MPSTETKYPTTSVEVELQDSDYMSLTKQNFESASQIAVLKLRIKELQDKQKENQSVMRQGYRWVPDVPYIVKPNQPSLGKKTLHHAHTGELIRIDTMTDEDRQMSMGEIDGFERSENDAEGAGSEEQSDQTVVSFTSKSRKKTASRTDETVQ